MSVRDLIDWAEQQAAEADQFHLEKVGANVAAAYRRCAQKLRAALEEKPLSRGWREKADEEESLVGAWVTEADSAKAEVYRKCADALDAQHDEDRELLREVIKNPNNIISPALLTAIRKHLGGESDEA